VSSNNRGRAALSQGLGVAPVISLANNLQWWTRSRWMVGRSQFESARQLAGASPLLWIPKDACAGLQR
jgi:hypothetical protein